VGTVALSVAARVTGLHVIGVEVSPDLNACARQALSHPANSAFAERVRFIQQDVTARRILREAAGLAEGSADWVVMNPPFDVTGGVRESPDGDRRLAHVADPGALSDWCRTAAGLLKPGGRLGMIHRAAALDAILQALRGRFGDCRICPVHSFSGNPASRVLIRATRGSRAGLSLLPGLVLHRQDGRWTEEADSILRGEEQIAL
jgi:tRNA1(Val) A37 N6-methylase TrmN6